MSEVIWAAVGTVVAGAFGYLGVWLVQRNERRKSTTDGVQQFIDQIQEERAADREQLDKALARIDRLESRERLLLDYVAQLRAHIDQRSEPPPPPFPLGLSPHR